MEGVVCHTMKLYLSTVYTAFRVVHLLGNVVINAVLFILPSPLSLINTGTTLVRGGAVAGEGADSRGHCPCLRLGGGDPEHRVHADKERGRRAGPGPDLEGGSEGTARGHSSVTAGEDPRLIPYVKKMKCYDVFTLSCTIVYAGTWWW